MSRKDKGEEGQKRGRDERTPSPEALTFLTETVAEVNRLSGLAGVAEKDPSQKEVLLARVAELDARLLHIANLASQKDAHINPAILLLQYNRLVPRVNALAEKDILSPLTRDFFVSSQGKTEDTGKEDKDGKKEARAEFDRYREEARKTLQDIASVSTPEAFNVVRDRYDEINAFCIVLGEEGRIDDISSLQGDLLALYGGINEKWRELFPRDAKKLEYQREIGSRLEYLRKADGEGGRILQRALSSPYTYRDGFSGYVSENAACITDTRRRFETMLTDVQAVQPDEEGFAQRIEKITQGSDNLFRDAEGAVAVLRGAVSDARRAALREIQTIASSGFSPFLKDTPALVRAETLSKEAYRLSKVAPPQDAKIVKILHAVEHLPLVLPEEGQEVRSLTAMDALALREFLRRSSREFSLAKKDFNDGDWGMDIQYLVRIVRIIHHAEQNGFADPGGYLMKARHALEESTGTSFVEIEKSLGLVPLQKGSSQSDSLPEGGDGSVPKKEGNIGVSLSSGSLRDISSLRALQESQAREEGAQRDLVERMRSGGDEVLDDHPADLGNDQGEEPSSSQKPDEAVLPTREEIKAAYEGRVADFIERIKKLRPKKWSWDALLSMDVADVLHLIFLQHEASTLLDELRDQLHGQSGWQQVNTLKSMVDGVGRKTEDLQKRIDLDKGEDTNAKSEGDVQKDEEDTGDAPTVATPTVAASPKPDVSHVSETPEQLKPVTPHPSETPEQRADRLDGVKHDIDVLLLSISQSSATVRNFMRRDARACIQNPQSLLQRDFMYLLLEEDQKKHLLLELIRLIESCSVEEREQILAPESVPVLWKKTPRENREEPLVPVPPVPERAPQPSRPVLPQAPEPGPLTAEAFLDDGEDSSHDEVQDVPPASHKVAKPNILERVRAWVNPATEAVRDSYIVRTHIRGEITEKEQLGTSRTLSRPAMIAGGIASAAMSYFAQYGIALGADVVRFSTQRYFVGKERDEIGSAFKEAIDRHKELQARGEEVDYRYDALETRVHASRYLTIAQKDELLSQLRSAHETFVRADKPEEERLSREVGRILEHTIRTRVSADKVVKEAFNTTLAIAGFQFLRAPAYAGIGLAARYAELRHERPEISGMNRLSAVVHEGFTDWRERFAGKRGRFAQAAAVGTLFRFAGMSATFVEGIEDSEFIHKIFHAWEQKESAYPPGDVGISSDPEVYHRVEAVHVQASHSPEVAPPNDAPSLRHEPPSPLPEAPSGTHETIPDHVASPIDHGTSEGVVLDPRNIPGEALPHKGDGITQALLAAVEARRDLLRDVDARQLNDDATAALLVRRFAARDGLLHYWLSEKAIGHVAIVPIYDAEGVGHISFLNPQDGTAYSAEELKSLGWLVKSPKT